MFGSGTRSFIAAKLALAVLLAIAVLAPLPALAASAPPRVDVTLLGEVIGLLEQQYLPALTADELKQAALDGIVKRLDPYSAYLTPEQYRQAQRANAGTVTGIGVTIHKPGTDSPVTVVRVLEETPAEAAGLRGGDRIVSVNGEDVTRLDAETVAGFLRGEPGTTVLVEVARDGQEAPLLFHLSRREIRVRTVTHRELPGGFGYISLTGFTEETALEFAQAELALRARGMRGLVVDLRDNPGGLVNPALQVASRLVPPGPLVHVVRRSGPVETLNSRRQTRPLPVAVLVGERTASAAELLAGALRDRAGAVLVGRKTFGKAVMQVTVPLSNGGGLKFTFARFRTPNGYELDGKGLMPDVPVERRSPDRAGEAGGQGDPELAEALRHLAAKLPN